MTPKSMKCGACGARAIAPEVLPRYETELDHDGRTYRVELADLATFRCAECGTIILDDEAQDRLVDGLRDAAGLMKPAKIRHRRDALGIARKDLAAYLQISPSTLSRWENGAQIQQRCMDVLLRLFFEVPAVRDRLGVHAKQGRGEPERDVGVWTPPRSFLTSTNHQAHRSERPE